MVEEVMLKPAQLAEAVREGIQQASSSFSASDWASIGVSAVLVFLTAILAYYTKNLAVEAKKTREFQSDPNIIVTAVHDENNPSLLLLVIRNIGNGLAKEIQFTSSKQIMQAFGIGNDEIRAPIPMQEGPFVDGISSLGPNENIKIYWGQSGGLNRLLGKETIEIRCEFKSSDNRNHVNNCSIDVASFMKTVASESMIKKIANALEGIEKNTKNMVK